MREIALTRGFVAIVDDEDYERVDAMNWQALVTGGLVYAVRKFGPRRNLRSMLLHRFLMGLDATSAKTIDHINGNGLDNRRDNLRVCTMTQNQGNRLKRHATSSRYKGVRWHRGARKWNARLRTKHGERYLGLHVREDDAARAYDVAAREYFGEFAALNFPSTGERCAVAC